MNTVGIQWLENVFYGAVFIKVDRWVLPSRRLLSSGVVNWLNTAKQLHYALLPQTVVCYRVEFETVQFNIDRVQQGNSGALQATGVYNCTDGTQVKQRQDRNQPVKRFSQRRSIVTLSRPHLHRSLFIQLPWQEESGI